MAAQFPTSISSWALIPYDCLSQIGRRQSPAENAQLTMTCQHFYQGRPAIEAQLRMDRRFEMRELFSFIERYFPKISGGYQKCIDVVIDQQTLATSELTEVRIKMYLLQFLKFLNKELLKLILHEQHNGIESFHSNMKTLYVYEVQRKIKGTFKPAAYQKFIHLANSLIDQHQFDWAVEIALHIPMPAVRYRILEKVAQGYANIGDLKKSQEITSLIFDNYCSNIDTIPDAKERDSVRLEACRILAQMKILDKALNVFKSITVKHIKIAALKLLHKAFPD